MHATRRTVKTSISQITARMSQQFDRRSFVLTINTRQAVTVTGCSTGLVTGFNIHADLFGAKRFRAMMHKGAFPRAAIRARKRTLVHHRAETLRAEKIGALSDPNLLQLSVLQQHIPSVISHTTSSFLLARPA